MGCRFPGANNPTEFWKLLQDGVDAITDVPADRFKIDEYYDPELGRPGKMNSRWGGFISDVDRFDADFFGITPREAESMDPQQRILLEIAYEALEDGGIPLERIAGSNTGVFIGIAHTDYADRLLVEGIDPTPYFGTGRSHSLAANRISYTFNLHGPSVALDTACSSSLVALHLACQSLRRGECDLALVGGVNLILAPMTSVAFSQAHMLSSDGRCKSFDASADGYVRSEGCGVVVLKRLSAAVRDGDVPAAVIRGSAMNEDGRTNGVMAPSESAQEAVVRSALRDAGLRPTDIDYVEAHGTGTPLGDPIELDALKAVLTDGRPVERPLIVGSAKTNVGHTEAAAGMVSLIRTVLILQRHLVPAHLHLKELNPAIDLRGVPLRIVQSLTPLQTQGQVLRAGINGFGFGGTNCHAILEEAVVSPTRIEPPVDPRPEILTLSARSPEALMATVSAYQASLAEWEDSVPLHDVCATAALHRTQHDERLALVADSYEGMRNLLDAFEQGEELRSLRRGSANARHGKTAFVFSGMGTQWIGMGRQLLEQEPTFRATIERCDAAMRRIVDWSVRDEILAGDGHSHLDDIGVLQPVLFAVAVALADLWRSWGIEPAAVVGHSVGEIAAACTAGVLSLDDAARIVCCRAAALRPAGGQGAMLSVGLSATDAERVLEGYEGQVSAAVFNSPANTVLSGDPQPLSEIAARLDREEIFCRPVKSDIAFHSVHMDALMEPFARSMGQIQAREGAVRMYSSVTAEPKDGREFTLSYWVRNLREPVQFGKTIAQMMADGYDTFVEVSPHPVLLHSINETAESVQKTVIALPSIRRNESERQVMLESLGELYVNGWPVQWTNLFDGSGQRVSLPAYPWQRDRFWLERRQGDRTRRTASEGHPLLGHRVVSAAHAGKHVWEVDLDFDTFPYLADHQIADSPVFPAAGFAEMALAAAQAMGPGPHVVEDLTIMFGLVLAADQAKTLQIVATPDVPGTAVLQFLGREAPDASGQDVWRLHATATVRSEPAELHQSPDADIRLEDFEARAERFISAREHHRDMDIRSLGFGPAFACVEGVHCIGNQAVARIHLTAAAGSADRYNIHPVLLDASFQTLSALTPLEPYLPATTGAIRLYDVPAHGLWVHAVLHSEYKYDDQVFSDIRIFNADGQVVADVRQFSLQRRKVAADETVDEWLYKVRWESASVPAAHSTQRLPDDWQGSWLILADQRGEGQRLASLLKARGLYCILAFVGDTYRDLGSREFRLNPSRPDDFRRMLSGALVTAPPLSGVVHLWSADVATSGTITPELLQEAQDPGSIGVMHLVQVINTMPSSDRPRIWLVTRGAQSVEGIDENGLIQSPILGLARVLANEHPEFKCARIDLDPMDGKRSTDLLLAEMLTQDREDEVAYRGEARYVRRLARLQMQGHDTPISGSGVTVTADTPFRLATESPGVLDNLRLGLVARVTPGPGELEIRVVSAGLNFRDVMSAMGMLPGYPDGLGPLGYECAGVVTAVGPDVSEFRVGDEVVALGQHVFGSFAVVDTRLAVVKPRRVSFEEVVSIPVTFLTAYYALHHIGRIQKGESILIHAAAGGVGLAAVQIAQAAGATIFATAGSPEKREYLHSLGVESVMDSRSLRFADEIMQLTDGRGVDIVLNSLAGEFIAKSLSVLGPYGRFLEIGRRDIYGNSQLGLFPFQRNLSFSAIDLDRLQHERPELVGALLRDIMAQVEAGCFTPLPLTVFPVTEAPDAFRYMAQAKHTGKIVISMSADGAVVRSGAGDHFHSDGTYLITGGFGGIGLKLARWMVDRGARSLVLVGRRGPNADAELVLESLRNAGCAVMQARVDVAQEDDLARLFSEIRVSLPPLRGIVHAAGILDDATLMRVDRNRFHSVMEPKIKGAWNLHQLTCDMPLDFFVLFSSLATVFGNSGQGNYAAANQFLESLAAFRQARGLPALSISWGPWSEIGMVSSVELLDRLAAQGVVAIPPQHGLSILGRLLAESVTDALVANVDWKRRLEFQPAWKDAPFFFHVAHELAGAATVGAPASESMKSILAASPHEWQQALETYLREQSGRVMGISSRKISIQQSLANLGLDSLMAVELRNRIRIDLDVSVPTKAFLEGVAIEQIATMVVMQLLAKEPARVDGQAVDEELEEMTL